MSDRITEAATLLTTTTALQQLVSRLRELRDYEAMHTPEKVTFAQIVNSVAGTRIESGLRDYLQEIAEILDANEAQAVDDDLVRRLKDAEVIALALSPDGSRNN